MARLFKNKTENFISAKEKIKNNLETKIDILIQKHKMMKTERLHQELNTATNQFFTRIFDNQLRALELCGQALQDDSKLPELKQCYEDAYKKQDGIQYQHTVLESLDLKHKEVVDMVTTVLSVIEQPAKRRAVDDEKAGRVPLLPVNYLP